MKWSLSANSLKIIAILAMLIDHIAGSFISINTTEGQILHFIGRITAPIMCYFIAEGFYHTTNINKYILRMAIFALVSHFAYLYYNYGLAFLQIDNYKTSIMFTLLLGLLALVVWNSDRINKYVKIPLLICLCMLAQLGDYGAPVVILILLFGIFRNNKKQQIISLIFISIYMILSNLIKYINYSQYFELFTFQLGIFLAIPLILKYDGTLGKSKNLKWLFYIFYPVHLIILGIIKWIN